MMKKIYINEESLVNIKKKRILPNFLFKLLKSHTTSLGDNDAFPSGDDYDFDYSVIKKRFNEVSDEIESLNLESLNEDYLMSEISSLIRECKDREKPMRDTLEKMCENLVNRLFAIPEDLINMEFKLVDKIKYENEVRVMPEPNEEIEHTFKDIEDIDRAKKSIAKRRFINSLIQGASYTYMRQLLNDEELISTCNDLIDLYERIIVINDYLLFIKKDKISDKNPMQGAYVETHIGTNENKTEINVQGLIFPLLLQESIRGLFELFSSHGLPSDNKKANYIIKKSDYLLAEPWDMRFGTVLWNKIFGDIDDTNIIPYVFMDFVKMPTSVFNKSMKEILSSTELGDKIKNNIIDNAAYNSDYQQFTNRINARNLSKSIINDGYFSASEVDSLELDGDDIDDDVIEEDGTDGIDYVDLVRNASEDDIDFIDGEMGSINSSTERLYVTINGESIPSELINLNVQIVERRISENKTMQFINPHIVIDKSLRGMNLATKIYTRLALLYGALCSGAGRRVNNDEIPRIYEKLGKDPRLMLYKMEEDFGGITYFVIPK